MLFQVKTGSAEYAEEVIERISDNPAIHFAVSTEIFEEISARSPKLMDQVNDIGSDFNLVQSAEDGLSTLSGNLGIDVPDGLADAIPMAAAILGGARLVYGAVQAERTFKDADRNTKNKIQVIQALTLMSRVGISSAMAAIGGAGGAAVGSSVPLVGNLVGGLVGSAAGAGMGMYLNKHLEPHMLELGLNITGLDGDDLFYFKNKSRIDQRALEFPRDCHSVRPCEELATLASGDLELGYAWVRQDFLGCDSSQLTPKADLPSTVTDAAIAAPAHCFVRRRYPARSLPPSKVSPRGSRLPQGGA